MAVTVNTVDQLVSAIGGSQQDIIIESGTYILPNRLVSTVTSRKLIGRGNVTLNFINVPNGTATNPTVCLDFQNKSRIFNISINISPSSSTPQNVIGVRYKLLVNYKYQKVGSSNSSNDVPTILPNNTFVVGTTVYSYNESIRYYYEVINPYAGSAKGRVQTYTFIKSQGDYIWEFEKGADEADMDSSLMECKFSSSLSGVSNRQIIAVDYYGRNIESDKCTFTNVGTAIRLQFPRNVTLSAPTSASNPNQNGFYGHRKARLFRNTFTGVSRAFHITGDVTLRSAIIIDNVMGSSTINNSGGQLIYCDGNGGIKSSVISNNIVYNHNEVVDSNYSSTMLCTNGLFENNTVSLNKFLGRPSNCILFASTCRFLDNIITNNTIGDAVSNGISVNNCNGLLGINNTFSITAPNNVLLNNNSSNYVLSSNTTANNSRTINTFLNIPIGTHTRFMLTKNIIGSRTDIYRSTAQTRLVNPFRIQSRKF